MAFSNIYLLVTLVVLTGIGLVNTGYTLLLLLLVLVWLTIIGSVKIGTVIDGIVKFADESVIGTGATTSG